MSEHVRTEMRGALGCIFLSRPAAINALSADMIAEISAALTDWRDDNSVHAVLFASDVPKGFCAGGDVRQVRELVLAGALDEADAYFAAEYRMNALIAAYGKPTIALTHGIVMGGGLGIAGHCDFRVTAPDARFAMPESAIGFFADVGVNAVLAQTSLERAMLFLLSGVTVGAADALSLGLADFVIPADAHVSLIEDIVVACQVARPIDALARLMASGAVDAGDPTFTRLADRLPRGSGARLATLTASIGRDPALADLAAILSARSPASLVVTHRAQLAARRHMDVVRTLETDLALAQFMVRRSDFAEGVRAVLVDKDQRPVWNPAKLDMIPRNFASEQVSIGE